MKNIARMYWPEFLVALIAIFFAFRELGTFPATWADEGLFVILARSVAEGRGYTMPTMDFLWPYPNIVTAGPPLVLPVAFFIKLFGFSLTVARIPMALYILASSALFYVYTYRAAGRTHAVWATALLVTLSAFVNTGKPVLGEIPGFFFFLLGLLWLQQRRPVFSGLAFGMTVITKLTFGVLFPALGMAWLFALLQKDKREWKFLTIILAVSIVTFLAWPALMTLHGDLAKEIHQSVLGEGGKHFLYPLRYHAKDFLRFQFLYFDALFVLSLIGMWKLRKTIGTTTMVFITVFALANIVHILIVPFAPWYRYLLPAHLAFLPFVTVGIRAIAGKHVGTVLLIACIAAQTVWQWTYQGSHRSDEEIGAAAVLMEQFADTDLVVSEAEIFALLPQQHPHWFFVTKELERRVYDVFEHIPLKPSQHCLPVLRKVGLGDQREIEEQIIPVYKRFVLMKPPAEC